MKKSKSIVISLLSLGFLASVISINGSKISKSEVVSDSSTKSIRAKNAKTSENTVVIDSDYCATHHCDDNGTAGTDNANRKGHIRFLVNNVQTITPNWIRANEWGYIYASGTGNKNFKVLDASGNEVSSYEGTVINADRAEELWIPLSTIDHTFVEGEQLIVNGDFWYQAIDRYISFSQLRFKFTENDWYVYDPLKLTKIYNLVDECGDTFDAEDEERINQAKTAYNNLSAIEKVNFSREYAAKIREALVAIAEAKAVGLGKEVKSWSYSAENITLRAISTTGNYITYLLDQDNDFPSFVGDWTDYNSGFSDAKVTSIDGTIRYLNTALVKDTKSEAKVAKYIFVLQSWIKDATMDFRDGDLYEVANTIYCREDTTTFYKLSLSGVTAQYFNKNWSEPVDSSKLNNVIDAINGIGTVTYTDGCKEKIQNARNLYMDLISNYPIFYSAVKDYYQTLRAAEIAYNNLRMEADPTSDNPFVIKLDQTNTTLDYDTLGKCCTDNKLYLKTKAPIFEYWQQEHSTSYYYAEDSQSITKTVGSKSKGYDGTNITNEKSSTQLIVNLGASFTYNSDPAKLQYLTINGSFTCQTEGIKIVIENFKIAYKENGFDFYRQELVDAASQALASLDYSSITYPDSKTIIEAAEEAMWPLTNTEKAAIDEAARENYKSCVEKYDALKATAAGKNVTYKTYDKENISVTSGTAANIQAIYFTLDSNNYYPCYKKSWTEYASFEKAATITSKNGNKKVVPANFLKPEADGNGQYKYIFLTANWSSGYSGVEFKAGDVFSIDSLSIRYEDSNTYVNMYIKNFVAYFSGSVWLNEEDYLRYAPVAKAIYDIGEVTLTSECKAKIDDAQAKYDAVKGEILMFNALSQQAEILNQAVTTYKTLLAHHNAEEVESLINSIGTVTLTDDCKTKIEIARTAYETLDTLAQGFVGNLDVLEAAEKTYIELVDQKSAADVTTLINAIGDVSNTETCANAINEAREAYDALNDNAKGYVDGDVLAILVNAEDTYKKLGLKDRFAAAINSVNDNSTADEIYSAIVEALNIYNQIDDKTSVAEDYAKLTQYIARYNSLIAEANGNASKSAMTAFDAMGIAFSSLLAIYGLYVMTKRG